MVTWARMPAAWAAAAISRQVRMESALGTPWLRRLNSSVVNTTMPISRQPAAAARSKPARFSTSPM